MAYLTRDDIPFHYALADAFTVCDAYHCSFLGATDPNRYHMWTGWVGNDGKNGGPVLDNSEAGYDWSHLSRSASQQAGISWKIYQDAGAGLDAEHYWGWGDDAYIGNYGDNSLLYFHQYQNAAPGSPLYVGARTATDIVAQGGHAVRPVPRRTSPPTSCRRSRGSSRPRPTPSTGNWPANYGAWYVSQFLDALTAQPRGLEQDGVLPDVRRERRLLRPHGPADAAAVARRGLSTVDTTNEIFPGNARLRRRARTASACACR